MAQTDFVGVENVLEFPAASPTRESPNALDLVHMAADAWIEIEDRAAENEQRALAAEEAYLDLLRKTERRLKESSYSYEVAQKRIESLQAKLVTVERRARSAEAAAREARHLLALVEEAIRKRLPLSA